MPVMPGNNDRGVEGGESPDKMVRMYFQKYDNNRVVLQGRQIKTLISLERVINLAECVY